MGERGIETIVLGTKQENTSSGKNKQALLRQNSDHVKNRAKMRDLINLIKAFSILFFANILRNCTYLFRLIMADATLFRPKISVVDFFI